MTDTKLRILIIGAHPDDADIKAGGSASKWAALGHEVKLVSVTDGAAGHHVTWGAPLAARRLIEAQAAGKVIGATYEILGQPDGGLQPTLAAREQIIRLIRGFEPDLVITHRTVDYHPDHCYTGQLVQEASYMMTVPAVCPDVPHLSRCPVIMYFADAFKQPTRFQPDVVVDIEDTFDRFIGMLHCHQSQFYEWLPYNAGNADQVPDDDEARRAWLDHRMRSRLRPLALRFRELLVQTYGKERGSQIQWIEAFQVSEFGAPLDAETRARIFPFVPAGEAPASAFTRKEWADIPEGE